jgi:hypothetical protein
MEVAAHAKQEFLQTSEMAERKGFDAANDGRSPSLRH